MSKQTTIAHKVSCRGVGLHSGREVTLTAYPDQAGAGIRFRRTDVSAAQSMIPARYDLVADTRLGTTIRNVHGVSVATIEHLMAALWGAGVDNALIELDGPEVPIMDGSSEPFMFMLECAGLVKQAVPRRMIKLFRTVEVREGDSIARISPNEEGEEGLVIDLVIDFAHPSIKRQAAHYDFRDVTFKQALSRARTFGFAHEVEALRKVGLALGGSLDNAIVLGDEGIMNEGGLRYSDEFVRHKALDCLGDLFMAGLRIDGHCHFVRPGHAINNALLRALFADKNAYMIVQADAVVSPAFVSPVHVAAMAYA